MTAQQDPPKLTPPWDYYRRKGLSEMRPYVPGEDLKGISVSTLDQFTLHEAAEQGADPGGYIARNPDNHADQWYVNQEYSDKNLEPITERGEAAEDCFCDKCGWTGKALYPDYRHDGCGYGALPIWRMELYAAKKEAAELREENKRLRASVDELLLAPNPLDDENMRLRAAIREWAEATRAFNDVDSAWDNAIHAGEDAGIYVSAWTSVLARVKDAEANLRRLAEGESES